jgi:hypothetical protein
MAGTYFVTITVAGCASSPGSTTVVVKATPATPVVTAPAAIAASNSFTASVPVVAGMTYDWLVTGGTVVLGAGTNQVTITANASGTVSISITETDTTTSCVSSAGTASVPILPPAGPTRYYTLSPCRVYDTRNPSPAVDWAAPSLASQEARLFTPAGRCSIPSSAKALAVNVTTVDATLRGNVAMYPGNETAPTASVINYGAGRARANNAVVKLAPNGSVYVMNRGNAAVNFVLDVVGWFE